MHIQLKREWAIPSAVGGASFVLGVVTTTALGIVINLRQKKEPESEYIPEFRKEIEEFRKEVQDIRMTQTEMNFRRGQQDHKFTQMIEEVKYVLGEIRDKNEGGQRSLDDYAAEMRNASPEPVVEEPEEPIFEINGEWNDEEERKSRSSDAPYVITATEFYGREKGYKESSLTYYRGDDVLCDDNDTPIYNKDVIVGELKFGHGSNDSSIVYIRNEALEAEYEVLLDESHYQVEILGQELGDILNEDLKHSNRPRKFRLD